MKHKILIIDDSVVNINALYVMLKDSYQIYVAKSGEEGIKEAKDTEPSLILLDMLMPGMDGAEVLELLMRDPLTNRIPVIFIASQNDDKTEEKGLVLGAVDFITKPFNPSIIKAKVKTHIELFEYRKLMENIAMLDGLTCIPNRRSYDERIKECWESAWNEQLPISVAILDIDFFKEYNDNYGHLKGDKVLKQVAMALKKSLPRKGGFLARYGGEEFIVILMAYEETDARDIIDEMREAVRSLGIEHLHSVTEPVVTISAGGATIIPDQMEIETFVDKVDKRLYLAKSAGRNRTVWEELGETKEQIEVSLFGHLQLRTMNGELSDHKKRKSPIWLLLAFLIINREKEYTKEELIRAIWPNDSVYDVSYELRMLLEELRIELMSLKLSCVRELIVTVNGVYHWNNAYECKVDVEAFEGLCKKAKEEKDEEACYQLCEHAVSYYKGEFLEKITAVDWVAELRKWFVGMQEEVLDKLLGICFKREEYRKILTLCLRQLYNEHFDDKVHYYYIKALIACKRNKEALNHYEYILESYYAKQLATPPVYLVNLYQEIIGISKEKLSKINQVEELFTENAIAVGAYYCDMHVFKNIYQLEARNMIRSGIEYYLGLVDIEQSRYFDKRQSTIYMHDLFTNIKRGLRIGDVFCKISEFQFAILLPCSSSEEAHRVMERIVEEFYQDYEEDKVDLSWELEPVKPVETLHGELETMDFSR